MAISAQDAQQKTRELFGLADDEDLSWITDEFLAEEGEQLPSDAALDFPRTQYGSRMSYGHRDGWGPTYEYFAGVNLPNYPTSPGHACGGSRWWAAQSYWNHDNINQYCGGSGQPAYRRIFRLTYSG